MHRRCEQLEDLRSGRVAAFPAHGAQVWNGDAGEDVPFPVFAGAGLEEPLEDGGAGRVGARAQPGADVTAHTIRGGPRRTP